MGKQKYTFEIIKKSFEDENYILLSTEYKKYHSYLYFICPNGHKHKITLGAWNQGIRCGKCYNFKLSYEFVKQSFENEGYQLLSTEYNDNKSYLEFICPNGHQHKIRWAHWQKGVRCGRCFGNIEVTYEQVKQSFEADGYKLLSTEYKGNKKYLESICPKGHKHKTKWNRFSSGGRCGICAEESFTSKGEKEILEYINSIYSGTILSNDRTQILNPKTNLYLELDIWLPEINKAIEYNGQYWHRKKYVKWKDNYKRQYCIDNNIDLLIIDHEKWIKNKDFNKILTFINN